MTLFDPPGKKVAGQNKWFSKFPFFKYSPEHAVSEQFMRIAEKRGWKRGSKNWKKNWNLCMGSEYDRLIGQRVCSLTTWQHMCGKLRLDATLPSITQCKKALSKVYVNIIDLLECWNSSKMPRLFRTKEQLAQYTKDTGRYFRRDDAKQDKVLRVVLKRLL